MTIYATLCTVEHSVDVMYLFTLTKGPFNHNTTIVYYVCYLDCIGLCSKTRSYRHSQYPQGSGRSPGEDDCSGIHT